MNRTYSVQIQVYNSHGVSALMPVKGGKKCWEAVKEVDRCNVEKQSMKWAGADQGSLKNKDNSSQ